MLDNLAVVVLPFVFSLGVFGLVWQCQIRPQIFLLLANIASQTASRDGRQSMKTMVPKSPKLTRNKDLVRPM